MGIEVVIGGTYSQITTRCLASLAQLIATQVERHLWLVEGSNQVESGTGEEVRRQTGTTTHIIRKTKYSWLKGIY